MNTPLDGAVCAQPGQDPDLWFPVGYTAGPDLLQIEYAKAKCRRCPVRTACLRAALASERGLSRHSRHGILGALTPGERAGTEAPRSSKPARCGTVPGYRQHLASEQTPCQPCQAAEDQRQIRWRAHMTPAECGTKGGYKRHITRHEKACAPCREAYRLARIEYRAAKRMPTAA